MANVSSSNGIEKCPQLRFPEFTEPWSCVKLSEFTERVMRKNKNSETDLPLTISSKDGLVDQVSFFNKTVASKDMSGYYLLLNGEYAYNKSYSVGYDFGSIKRLDRYPMGALSTLYICFAIKKYNSDFIKTYFDSLKWYKEIYMISAEGARNHGLLNVPTDEFFDTYHYLTKNEAEQFKIAKLMELIEQRIQKQQALVEDLKKYKRGVMSSYFNGKLVLKHPIGQHYSHWQEFTLSDVSDEFKSGKSITSNEINEVGEYAVYGGNGVRGYTDHYSHEGQYIVVGRQGALCGNVRIIDGKNYLSEHAIAVKANSNHYTPFLLYLLTDMRLGQYSDQGAQPGLAVNKLLKLKRRFPEYDEQVRFATFMQQIDHKLSSEENKLEYITTLKRGLLQQLFI